LNRQLKAMVMRSPSPVLALLDPWVKRFYYDP
jgi:hypothetical protein